MGFDRTKGSHGQTTSTHRTYLTMYILRPLFFVPLFVMLLLLSTHHGVQGRSVGGKDDDAIRRHRPGLTVRREIGFVFSGGGLCIIRIRFDFLIMFVVIVWIMEKNHGYLLLEGTNHFQS